MNNHDNRPTHLDLFSGIGGFALAFESAGFRTIGFAEIEPYAAEVLAKRWPNVHNHGDVRNVTRESAGNADVLTGGFPCQPFSVAGERRGNSDERFLWPECVRTIREIRPRFALFENVPGILTIDGGRTFNRVLSDISALGYDILWNLIPACAVGAYHERDRIWIVCADSKRAGLPGCERGQGFLVSEIDAHPKPRYLRSDFRNPLDEARESLCFSDGLSVGLVRSQIQPYGNAIVPQVAFIFAKAIYQILRP